MKKIVNFSDIFLEQDFVRFEFNSSQLIGKKILVTGTQGMVGTALKLIFSETISDEVFGCQLYFASRSWAGIANVKTKSNIFYITNDEARGKKLQFDVIIHCASPSNVTKISSMKELHDINTGFLADCLTSRTQKVIFISSGEIYGGLSTQIDSERVNFDIKQRRNWYPISKIETELFLQDQNLIHGISIDIIRLFHTFGPGVRADDGRSFSDIIYGAIESNQITLKSSGLQVRSFLYLGDAIFAIVKCLELDREFRVLNVGSEHPISILEFAKLVSNLTGAEITHESGDFEHSPFDSIVPDISETRLIGWQPQIHLSEAINRTIAWIKN